MRREVWVDLFNNLRHNAYVLLWTHLIPPTIKFGRRLNRLKLAVFAFLKKRHFEFTIHVKWLFIIAFLGILAFPSHSTPISLPQQPYPVPKALKLLETPVFKPQSQVASVYVAPTPVTNCGSNPYMAYIYQKESGCATNAVNPGGCTGLGQACPGSKLPCSLYDWTCQDDWFRSYAISTYGSIYNAYIFRVNHNYW